MGIKSNSHNLQSRGFTIVELLIVIVIIGILAAITIVAYNGITSKASLQKSVTAANSVRDVAENYSIENGKYPAITSQIITGTPSTRLPSNITIGKGGGVGGTTYAGVALALAATTTTTSITTPSFLLTGTAAIPTGGVIFYWDPTISTPAVSSTYLYYGSATPASTFTAPAS